MAGKAGGKSAVKKAADAQEKGPRSYFVRLELEEADHRRLRVRAAKEGVPMSTFVKTLVVNELKGVEA